MEKQVDSFYKSLIGLDKMLDIHRSMVPKSSSFPPYNIRKTGDSAYQIELAVAGFTIADIEILLDKNVLTIKSNGHDPVGEFLHQGFAYRGFARAFTLVDGIKVHNAELINGILRVYLEKQVDEQKPVRINITAPDAKSHPQLLNEDSSI